LNQTNAKASYIYLTFYITGVKVAQTW